MAYTHTFEIKINGTDIQGQLDMTDANNIQIKFDAAPEMPMHDFDHMFKLLNEITKICQDCGNIISIEIAEI